MRAARWAAASWVAVALAACSPSDGAPGGGAGSVPAATSTAVPSPSASTGDLHPADAVAAWQGILPAGTDTRLAGVEDAWTMTTGDGSRAGMLPANPSGFSEGGGQRTLVTRWEQGSVAPGESSAGTQDGRPQALVFFVPQRDDGSLGVRGLALLDADRKPVASVDVADWTGESDPQTF